MTFTSDLQQNVFYAVYFTVTHNLPVFIYGAGICISALMAIIKPKRSYVLFLLGFIILLFAFEYQKHILDGLKEQTINALITVQEHNLVRRVVNIILIKLLPLGMPLIGWSFIILGVYLHKRK
ncbi:MAG: hypothetical protein WA061_06860 [Microgenomates group bacterium]